MFIFSSGSPSEIKTPEPKQRLPTQERPVRASQPTERRNPGNVTPRPGPAYESSISRLKVWASSRIGEEIPSMQGAGFAPSDQKQSVALPFREALYRGKEWEWKVYRFLKLRFPDIRKPLTYEEALQGLDKNPDMSLRGMPIQCKRREFEFTDASDFPYPTILVDEDYKLRSDYISAAEYAAMEVDEKKQNLRQFLAYFIANASMTHMGVVLPATKANWSLTRSRLSRDNRDAVSWECPVSRVLWVPVAEWRKILTRV